MGFVMLTLEEMDVICRDEIKAKIACNSHQPWIAPPLCFETVIVQLDEEILSCSISRYSPATRFAPAKSPERSLLLIRLEATTQRNQTA